MPFHKILCPLCLSDHPRSAMTTAVRLTVAFDAELVFADTWSIPPMAFAGDVGAFPTESLLAFAEREQRELAVIVKECKKAGVERVSSRLVVGAPTAEVLTMLESDPGIDLVVMGVDDTNRYGGPLLDGPIKRVLRRAPCSVLVAHPAPQAVKFENILCPIDFSETSSAATAIACELADPDGTITLLHITEASVLAAASSRPERVQHDAEAEDTLERWAETLRARTTAEVATVARSGRPAAEILDELRIGSFDLVVLGAYRPASHRLGTVAAKVLRHATCPVLLAHPRN
ncbi:MAG TPA: universal stress protein [Kofleriaceae bacterium]|nr:universal stress protein [Kofleriaceae bacterium]